MRAFCFSAFLLVVTSASLAAQDTQVPFGGMEHDTSAQVEITADTLQLDQAAGTAVFTGAVKVGQGDLRMAADRVEVFYVDDGTSGQIDHLIATGSVTLSNGTEAAEAEKATYEVASGIVEMQGNVLLTQGSNALSSQKMRIDLNTGTGVLEGRVKTIFQPGTTE
jgi:lipopolysaccharide export system protein LptA